MVKKRDKFLFFLVVGLFLLQFFGQSGATYLQGVFWSRIDDTLVLTNETDNVCIGDNATTEYKLFVDGTSAVSENFTVDNDALVSGDLTIGGNVYSDNTINISSSGDTDDYIQFSTGSILANIPDINIIGTTTAYILSDDANYVYFNMYKDASNQAWFGTNKVDGIFEFSSMLPIRYYCSPTLNTWFTMTVDGSLNPTIETLGAKVGPPPLHKYAALRLAAETDVYYLGSQTAGQDIQTIWDGETNQGDLTWMEDEDEFQCNDVFNSTGGLVLPTSIPGSPVPGSTWLNCTTNEIGTYNGTSWRYR